MAKDLLFRLSPLYPMMLILKIGVHFQYCLFLFFIDIPYIFRHLSNIHTSIDLLLKINNINRSSKSENNNSILPIHVLKYNYQ